MHASRNAHHCSATRLPNLDRQHLLSQETDHPCQCNTCLQCIATLCSTSLMSGCFNYIFRASVSGASCKAHRPSVASCCRPCFRRRLASKHASGCRFAYAALIYPAAPQAEPGMTQTPCFRTSHSTIASSSSHPARPRHLCRNTLPQPQLHPSEGDNIDCWSLSHIVRASECLIFLIKATIRTAYTA